MIIRKYFEYIYSIINKIIPKYYISIFYFKYLNLFYLLIYYNLYIFKISLNSILKIKFNIYFY